MLITSVIAFFVVIAITIYGFLYNQFTYWKRRNIPYIKPNWIYGNTKEIEKTIHHTKFWCDIYQKLKHQGPVGGIYVFFNPIAIITDLDLIRQILIKDFHIFPDRAHYFDQKNDPISAHLANIEGSYWRFIRNKLSPAFSTGKLKAMYQPLADLSDRFLKVCENLSQNGDTVDMRDLSVRFVSDVLGLIGFGIDCNSMSTNDSEYHKIAVETVAGVTYLKKTFLECNREFFKLFRITPITKATREFYTRVVDDILKYRNNNDVQRNDILSLMINSKDNSRPLLREEIIPQSGVFLVAGHETTVTVMTHCIYEWSLRKDLQEKARNSVIDALKEADGKFSYEAIQKMDYIEQCIFETARKYFISISVRRKAVQDYKVPNTNIVIEKGTIIQIPVFAINNDPEIYPEPEKWDPDRYAPEEMEKRHKSTFLIFGDGPRLCIGKRLSITILKIVLAKFLLAYDFTLDTNKTSVPIKHCIKTMFLTPTEGIYLKLNKIE